MSIRILPDEVASQIAAGEVIERPASVVKELLENSLDASSKQISIIVEGAGKRLIEVADDGTGIQANELPLAIARHGTSKLSTAEDLFRISTLGFRGEALASIASVARLTITSHQVNEITGARFIVEGGKIGTFDQVGVPTGTVVRVEDLFFNVPARLSFLKQEATEKQQIDNLVTRYALAYPDVRFRLVQDGRVTLQTSGNGIQREVLSHLYGVEVARQMLEVIAREEGLEIGGYISPISVTRSNRREITFFVNGRWIQDVPLTTALVNAYHTLLMVGRFPMAVIFLQVSPEMIDVNVHPAKAEIRFRQSDRIFSGVQRAVRRALLAYSPIPQVVPATTWQGRMPDWEIDLTAQISIDHGGRSEFKIDLTQGIRPEENTAQPSFQDPSGLARAHLPLLRLVGQVGATYLIAEGPDGLYLIDQHAAHERVLFEKFMKQKGNTPSSQILLQPVPIDVSPQNARLLLDQLPVLKKSGFEIELFGSTTLLIRALPTFISGSDPLTILNVLVENFEEDEAPLQAEVEARIIARICKRAAVKGGTNTLSGRTASFAR